MKKFLASILALCLLCSSGIFGIRAFAVTETEKVDDSAIHDDSRTDSDNYTNDGFAIAPHIILNQETNCYDIDIYVVVVSSNKYFSNFEAEINIYYDGENSKTPKLSIEQYATGNFTAGITKNMDTGTTLNIVFNAPKNVDMSAGYVVNFNDENSFIFKLATIKTDIKQNVIEEGSELDSSATVIRMGFYAEGGEVKTAGFINGNKVISFAETIILVTSYNPVLPGDYDFDGVLTVKDLITAQYYLTNHTYPQSEFLMNMLTSTGLQYLQMYLCETISFSDYFISLYLYKNAGMIEEKRYECDTYWDYDYWGDEDFPTDEQGYKYLGEDRYGNYHVWNEKQGVKFFVKMDSDTAGIHFYTIGENGEIGQTYQMPVSVFGTETFYGECDYVFGGVKSGWLCYWDEASLEKQGSDDIISSERYEYKGTDIYGFKHYWNKTNGFKFMTHGYDDCAYRYLISPNDNRLLIVGYEEKWWID